MHPCGVEQIRNSILVKEGTDLCLRCNNTLGSGEMPSEIFQEHVLYFGEERCFCCKILIFVGTSKGFQSTAVFSLRPKITPSLKVELIN